MSFRLIAVRWRISASVWAMVLVFHLGEIESKLMIELILCMYIWKMGFELVATPLAAKISSILKHKEGMDTYDIDTNFNPFKL